MVSARDPGFSKASFFFAFRTSGVSRCVEYYGGNSRSESSVKYVFLENTLKFFSLWLFQLLVGVRDRSQRWMQARDTSERFVF